MVLGRTMLVLVLSYIVLVPVPTSVDGLLFDFLLDCDLVCGHPAKFEEVHKTNCGCLLGDVKLLDAFEQMASDKKESVHTIDDTILSEKAVLPQSTPVNLPLDLGQLGLNVVTSDNSHGKLRSTTTLSMCDYLCSIQEGGAACDCSAPIVPG